ncbi:MAG: type II secretion system F family protein [Treponema sp.]|jgi:type II secretory pathway component PulF|nr:type II secretion system F family protein [Treponema sp.]
MPYYRCTLADEKGKRSTIVREAANREEIIVSYNGKDQLLVKCVPVEDYNIARFKKNFSRDIILEFTEIMAALLKAGLTIQDAVGLCVTIAGNSKTAWLSRNLLEALRNGLSLHEALKMHTPSFSPLYQALIRLGEETGSVAAVFSRMAQYLRNEKKIRGKIGNIVWYPLLILGITFIGCVGIIVFVLPRMAEIFAAFNIQDTDNLVRELSGVYRSLWLTASFFVLLITAAILVLAARKTSDRFAFLTDKILLGLPLAGPFIKSLQTMDFSFAMEMLTGSGITIHTALTETSSAIRNRAYAGALIEVESLLRQGETLSRSFMAYHEFPPYVATWIAVGERTGNVENVFTQIRGYFEEEVDHISEKIMGMLEPGLILLVGIIVLLLIIQFILPIFSLYGRLL